MVVFLLFCTLFSSGQDAIFSQFYAAPLYTNPGLAGAMKCGRLSVNYRNQWSMIPGAFSTVNASYDQHFDDLSGALGFVVTNLREGNGSYSTTNVGVIYSYSLEVNDVFAIKTAVQASFVNRRVDWDNLTFPDQFLSDIGLHKPRSDEHGNFPEMPISKKYADFSTGIVGYSENFYAGFAIHHLGTPNEALTRGGIAKLPMKYTIHAGAVIDLLPKQRRFRDANAPTLSPNIIYQQQGTAQQINYGMYANNILPSIVFGLWYRQTISFNRPESLTFLVGFKHNTLSVGYSYDLSVSKLYRISGGSHELSMSYLLPCREPKVRVKKINCPSF
ncbi:MAG: type IX secretion system membrane protein PorP/SprF [Bacteroidales bacterium]|nr:type IX secretion system membrane protein PorP/SprF [Bacteroidales bacterium]